MWLCALALFLGAPGLATAAPPCPAQGGTTDARLSYVIDGDTLILAGGDRVRLIGIDAPELGREGAADQPLAAQATVALRALTGAPGSRLALQPGSQPRDRHGRRLAYLFAADGSNLAEQLLRKGLAYQAAIPPNLRYADCYAEVQTEARRRGLGLWAGPALDAAALPPREGFMRVRGRVERVHDSRRGLWIELAGGMGLNIRDDDRPTFAPQSLDSLPGQEIEALGWVFRVKGTPRMRLRHPSTLLLGPHRP